MFVARLTRAAAAVVLGAGLLGGALAAPPAQAKGTAAVTSVKPVMLIVDNHIVATGLSASVAMSRASALLPITVTVPSYVPAGSQLLSISVEPPLYQITRGLATLIYGSPTGGSTFEVDESPLPIYYAKAKQSTVVINHWAGTVSDLGAIGKAHLMAITWSLGPRSFAVTSNVGKSGLSTDTLLKVANALR
jgi:hypothetical protein